MTSQKIKRSSSDAEKLASENYVPSQNYMEKAIFAPNQLKFR